VDYFHHLQLSEPSALNHKTSLSTLSQHLLVLMAVYLVKLPPLTVNFRPYQGMDDGP
jgi:hypothetical protein